MSKIKVKEAIIKTIEAIEDKNPNSESMLDQCGELFEELKELSKFYESLADPEDEIDEDTNELNILKNFRQFTSEDQEIIKLMLKLDIKVSELENDTRNDKLIWLEKLEQIN